MAGTAAIIGPEAFGMAPFVASLALFLLPLRQGLAVWAALLVCVAIVVVRAGGGGAWFLLGILLMVGTFVLVARQLDVWGARHRQTAADLALVAERERVARDVHDVLGHSLTVLTVKAELAERLVDADPERAKSELAQIRDLTRQSLAEIRATVGGLRVARLADELEASGAALADAGIGAQLPSDPTVVDPRHRIVLAWSLREAVTNVVRHSRASTCSIELGPDWLVVTDDGRGLGRASRGQRSARAARARRRGRRHRRAGWHHRRHDDAGAAVSVIRVLLADDQALVRGAMAALLTLEPDIDVVAEVGRGDEVVDAVRRTRPDVCLLDIEMPGRDGIEVAADLAALTDVVSRVLIVTTFSRPGYLRRALDAGACGFVVKDTPAARARRRRTTGARRPPRDRPCAGHRVAGRRPEPAQPARAGGAARDALRRTGGDDRRAGASVGGDGSQPPVLRHRQDRHEHAHRGGARGRGARLAVVDASVTMGTRCVRLET